MKTIFCWCSINEDIEWNRIFELSSVSAWVDPIAQLTSFTSLVIITIIFLLTLTHHSHPHHPDHFHHNNFLLVSRKPCKMLTRIKNWNIGGGFKPDIPKLPNPPIYWWADSFSWIHLDPPPLWLWSNPCCCKHCHWSLCRCQSDWWVLSKLDTLWFLAKADTFPPLNWLGKYLSMQTGGGEGLIKIIALQQSPPFCDPQTHKYTNTQINKYTNIQIHRQTNRQTNTQIHI